MVRGETNYKIVHMFSATMQPSVERMARRYLKAPIHVQIGEAGGTKKNIEQRIEFITADSQRRNKLAQLLKRFNKALPAIIFVNLKAEVESLTDFLSNSCYLRTTSIHGGKS
jgi:ATP-dependent RNA helicase DDX23/PRP28